MTLQNIKCHASTDLLTVVWMEHRPIPWVDFSINKQCRDFDTILQYNIEHAVDKDKFDAMPKPENAYIWPGPWIKHESELGVKLAPKIEKPDWGYKPYPGNNSVEHGGSKEWETHKGEGSHHH